MTIRLLTLIVIPLTFLAPPAAGQTGPWGGTLVPDREVPGRAAVGFSLESTGSHVRPPFRARTNPAFRFNSLPLSIEDSSRPPRRQPVLISPGVGAVVGAAVFLVQSSGCWREAESMCELGIPLYVGGGAVAGGLIGYLIGRRAP